MKCKRDIITNTISHIGIRLANKAPLPETTIPSAVRQVEAFTRQYNLTPETKRAMLTFVTAASVAKFINGKLTNE